MCLVRNTKMTRNILGHLFIVNVYFKNTNMSRRFLWNISYLCAPWSSYLVIL